MSDDNNSVGLNINTYNRIKQSGGFVSGVNTNSSSPTGSFEYAAANTGNSNKSIWETLIGNVPGIIASSSSLVTALKVNPNNINYQVGGGTGIGGSFFNSGNQNNNGGNNMMWLWVLLGVLILAALGYWALKGGKTASK